MISLKYLYYPYPCSKVVIAQGRLCYKFSFNNEKILGWVIPSQRQVVLKWVRILCGVQNIDGHAVVARVELPKRSPLVLVGTAKAYGERSYSCDVISPFQALQCRLG